MKAPDVTRITSRAADVPTWAWVALALVVQLAIIGSLVLAHYTTAATGQTVFLKISPVDPRDPLRGDYLSFTYEISRLDAAEFESPPVTGQTVYVPLVRGSGPSWSAGGTVSTRLPTPAQRAGSGTEPGAVFIRGVVKDTRGTTQGAVGTGRSGTVGLVYGIEQYFVPEGKAATFPVRTDNAVARVAVDADGKALLRQVYINGRAWP